MKLIQFLLCISISLGFIFSASGEKIVLQQGLNGYNGCKNLGIFDPVYPNRNYANNYTYPNARRTMISKFKC